MKSIIHLLSTVLIIYCCIACKKDAVPRLSPTVFDISEVANQFPKNYLIKSTSSFECTTSRIDSSDQVISVSVIGIDTLVLSINQNGYSAPYEYKFLITSDTQRIFRFDSLSSISVYLEFSPDFDSFHYEMEQGVGLINGYCYEPLIKKSMEGFETSLVVSDTFTNFQWEGFYQLEVSETYRDNLTGNQTDTIFFESLMVQYLPGALSVGATMFFDSPHEHSFSGFHSYNKYSYWGYGTDDDPDQQYQFYYNNDSIYLEKENLGPYPSSFDEEVSLIKRIYKGKKI